jgi:hypothetical protein
MRSAAIRRKTDRIIMRRPWHTGGRTVDSIARLWDIFYYDLLFKYFESRYELWDWCKVRLQQLNDPVYYEEQRLKAEEVKRLAREAEEKVRRETPGTWEHQKVIQEEANRRAREADNGGTTSETWPPPRSPSGISLRLSTEILQFIAIVVLKGLMGLFVIFFLL